jgi:protein adenylyltransferase
MPTISSLTSARNCTCLAQSLTPLIGVDAAKSAIEACPDAFTHHYVELMTAKLELEPKPERVDILIRPLNVLAQNRVDYTLFFRHLCQLDTRNDAPNNSLRDLFPDRESFDAWARNYPALLRKQEWSQDERQAVMRLENPKYILRNYLVEIAIRKATDENNYSAVNRHLSIMRAPFDEQPEFSDYANEPPDWAQNIEVSCSS